MPRTEKSPLISGEIPSQYNSTNQDDEDFPTRTNVGKKFIQRFSLTAPILEGVGTFILVFVICITSVTLDSEPLISTAIAIGGALSLCVYTWEGIFNPAVSLAVFLRGKISLLTLGLFVLLQLIGGLLGALTAYGITEKKLKGMSKDPVCPQISDTVSIFSAFVCEALWTFVLSLVVLNVATTENKKNNSYFGLAIGGTVAVGILIMGGLTGAVFNPSVATGPCIVYAMFTSKAAFHDLWLYWTSEILGAVLAAVVFFITNVEELRTTFREFSLEERLL